MRRLGLDLINLPIKFEMSMITCKETQKYAQIVVFSHLLGDLGLTHRVHLWLDGKRVVDFPLVVIDFFR